MLNSYHKQIFTILIVFIFTLFALTSLWTVRFVEQQQQNTIRDALLQEAETIAVLLDEPTKQAFSEAKGASSVDLSLLAERLETTSSARVTFIDQLGVVLGDSRAVADEMDNHLTRPEVIAATKKRFGSIIRYSDTTQQQTMYVAISLKQNQESLGYLRLAKSLTEVEQALNTVTKTLLLGMLLLFAVSLPLSWLIARSLSKPIHELREVAEHITHGDYSRRVQYKRVNEIGKLGQSINEMADSLQWQVQTISDSESRLKNVIDHLAVGVVLTDATGKILVYNPFLSRFTDKKDLHGINLSELHLSPEFIASLHDAQVNESEKTWEWRTYFPDERIIDVQFVPIASGMLITLHDLTSIRRLENMRSEFVANVSHELRTPLAAIRGFAETLKLGALHDTETALSFVQIIVDESDRLNRLVNDLLELSRIETNRSPLIYESLQPQQVVKEIRHLLRQEISAKHLHVTVHGDENTIIEVDRDRFRQIVINLMHNSIQYTPDGGNVVISWSTTGECLQLQVADNGIGIPEQDLPHVFQRFFRVDRARNRQSGGTGLGLAITKHLVELHKGTITAESIEGKGSTFTIELPLQQEKNRAE